MAHDVLVVIGAGGMGIAIARRLGPGKTVLLADVSEETLGRVGADLTNDGFSVARRPVDVSSHSSVAELAKHAVDLGPVRQVAHTAGVSPAQASAKAILRVDLVGVVNTLDEFATVVEPGGAGVVIASMAGYFAPPLAGDVEAELAVKTPDQILALPLLRQDSLKDPGEAYRFAKLANRLRVRAASKTWGCGAHGLTPSAPGMFRRRWAARSSKAGMATESASSSPGPGRGGRGPRMISPTRRPSCSGRMPVTSLALTCSLMGESSQGSETRRFCSIRKGEPLLSCSRSGTP